MSTARQKSSSAYPRSAQIGRAINAARANGIVVNTVEVDRKGRIRLSNIEAASGDLPADEFERWDRDGKL